MFKAHVLLFGDGIDGITVCREFFDKHNAAAFCNSLAAKSAHITSCGITVAIWRFGVRVK